MIDYFTTKLALNFDMFWHKLDGCFTTLFHSITSIHYDDDDDDVLCEVCFVFIEIFAQMN